MSEWNSVLAVYWALWAADGVRLGPRRAFQITRRWLALRGRIDYGRWTWLGVWPGKWRLVTPDVPLSLSTLGVCNRPVGSAGRPEEGPTVAQAWRWEEVREVGISNGWLFVNGTRFCPDTGHVTAKRLLELTRLTPAAREEKIKVQLRLWVRPTHLRRRVRVVVARTSTPAALNAISLVLMAGLTIYLAADVSTRVPEAWSAAVARTLPILLGGLFVLHVSAWVTAWQARGRLKPVGPQRRLAALLGALFLPPQALRLCAVVGDGFFPPQHPIAAALAFGDDAQRRLLAFQTLADLRWPISERQDPPLAREVTHWFRAALEAALKPHLTAANLGPAALLAPPERDASASCAYCPRCLDQFEAGPVQCPHGVELIPLRRENHPTSAEKK